MGILLDESIIGAEAAAEYSTRYQEGVFSDIESEQGFNEPNEPDQKNLEGLSGHEKAMQAVIESGGKPEDWKMEFEGEAGYFNKGEWLDSQGVSETKRIEDMLDAEKVGQHRETLSAWEENSGHIDIREWVDAKGIFHKTASWLEGKGEHGEVIRVVDLSFNPEKIQEEISVEKDMEFVSEYEQAAVNGASENIFDNEFPQDEESDFININLNAYFESEFGEVEESFGTGVLAEEEGVISEQGAVKPVENFGEVSAPAINERLRDADASAVPQQEKPAITEPVAGIDSVEQMPEKAEPFFDSEIGVQPVDRNISPEAGVERVITIEHVRSANGEAAIREAKIEEIAAKGDAVEIKADENAKIETILPAMAGAVAEAMPETVAEPAANVESKIDGDAVFSVEEMNVEAGTIADVKVADIVHADMNNIEHMAQASSADVSPEVSAITEELKEEFSETQIAEKIVMRQIKETQTISVERVETENAQIQTETIKDAAASEAAVETNDGAVADSLVKVDIDRRVATETIVERNVAIEFPEQSAEKVITDNNYAEINADAVEVTANGALKTPDVESVIVSEAAIETNTAVVSQNAEEIVSLDKIQPVKEKSADTQADKEANVKNVQSTLIIAGENSEPIVEKIISLDEKDAVPVVLNEDLKPIPDKMEIAPVGNADSEKAPVANVNITEMRSEPAIFSEAEKEIKIVTEKTAAASAEDSYQNIEVAGVDEGKSVESTMKKNVQPETAAESVDKPAKAAVEIKNRAVEAVKNVPEKEAANAPAIKPVEIINDEKTGTENEEKNEQAGFEKQRSLEGRDFLWLSLGFDGAPRGVVEAVKSATGVAAGSAAANDDQYSFGKNYGKVAEDAESGITMFRQRTNFKKAA
ncbi:MAG TPA: hypothetical protein VMV71_01690 [Candidatus Paceibacterota bacterium]|nr:hypothetical protein [Candidatus Paceibacterota bacterium]